MASAYIPNVEEITQDDLNRFYENIGEDSIVPDEYYNIEDLQQSEENDLNIIDDPTLSGLGIDDSDGEDSEYLLQLYSEGKIDDLSKILDEKKQLVPYGKQSVQQSKRSIQRRRPIQQRQPQQRQTQQRQTQQKAPQQKVRAKNIINTRTRAQTTPIANKNKTKKSPPTQKQKQRVERPKISAVPPGVRKETYGVELLSNKKQELPKALERKKNTSGRVTVGNYEALKYLQPLVTDEDEECTELQVTEKEVDEMQSIMDSWLEIDDELKEVNKIARTLREKKKAKTLELLQDMNQYNVGVLKDKKETQQVKYAVSYIKQGYKKDFIKDKLTVYLKDAGMAEKIAEYLEESREKKEKIDIRRGKVKVPK